MFAKATASDADFVILDLEDSVAATAKSSALTAVEKYLSAGDVRVVVRINPFGSLTFEEEISALCRLGSRGKSGLLGLMVPKSDNQFILEKVANRVRGAIANLPVIPIIESALGVINATEIASVPGVARLALGALDLSLDLSSDTKGPITTHSMVQIAISSRAARIAPPLDSPTTTIDAPDEIYAAARSARAVGFGGKLCIHPSQLGAARRGFAPSGDEIAWANSVITAGQASGVVRVDGRMVDAPVLEIARRILDYDSEPLM